MRTDYYMESKSRSQDNMEMRQLQGGSVIRQ